MERNAYRGTSRSARSSRSHGRKYDTEEKSDIRETILMQCIISSIILGSLLVLCMIHTDFTDSLRKDLKAAISEQLTFQDAAGDAQSMITGIRNAAGFLLGDEKETPQEVVTQTWDVPDSTQEPDTSSVNVPDTSSDFRIDEDILGEINARIDPYGTAEKKQIVPDIYPSPEQNQ